MRTEILVPNVEIWLLRKQRDTCRRLVSTFNGYDQEELIGDLNGLICMLDEMLDIAEGHTIKKPQ